MQVVVEGAGFGVREGYRNVGGAEVGDCVVERQRLGVGDELDDVVELVEDLFDQQAVRVLELEFLDQLVDLELEDV